MPPWKLTAYSLMFSLRLRCSPLPLICRMACERLPAVHGHALSDKYSRTFSSQYEVI